MKNILLLVLFFYSAISVAQNATSPPPGESINKTAIQTGNTSKHTSQNSLEKRSKSINAAAFARQTILNQSSNLKYSQENRNVIADSIPKASKINTEWNSIISGKSRINLRKTPRSF